MHAIGFWHEQSRADRDHHVKIDYNNIEKGKWNNFIVRGWEQSTSLDQPYDYESVMHYGERNRRGTNETEKKIVPHLYFLILLSI